MILISISLIFNVIVFYLDNKFNTESVIPFIIMGLSIGIYKSINSDSLKSSFNIKEFKCILNKQHIYELISSFLLSISMYNVDIYYGKFYLIDIPCIILFALFIYRFLLFNLLKTANSKSTYI